MKRRNIFLSITFSCLQIACVSQVTVASAPAENPYLAVAGHNPFGLVSPPSPTVQDIRTPPPEITLNGIMTIFGDKRALFKMRTQSGEEKSFILSEGQRDGDIELLSVDIKQNTITVNNRGVIQTVAICKAPVLPMIENPVAANGGVNQAANDNSKNSGNPDQMSAPEFQNVNGQPTTFQPGYQAGLAGSKAASSTDKGTTANGAAANGNQNSDGSNPASANFSTPKMDPWWIRGSKMVEQARLDSADAVLHGTADPQPLTPLTPPGTPANLIGPSQLFFEHM
jgi:hypothetical protein